MVNKETKILGIVLVGLLFLTIGFALYTQEVTIKGQARATGAFKITSSCNIGLIDDIASASAMGVNEEFGSENDSCDISDGGKKVNFYTELPFPGATRFFVIKFTNSGTYDAYFDPNNGMEGLSYKTCFDNNENGSYESSECYDGGMGHGIDLLGDIDFYALEDDKNNAYYFYSEEVGNLYSEMVVETDDGMYIKLKPGYSLYLYFKASLNDLLGNDSGGQFKVYTDLSIRFNFTQEMQ